MTVMPGSLDYLYYNGVLDYIPYEAYEMGPIPRNTNFNNQNNLMHNPMYSEQDLYIPQNNKGIEKENKSSSFSFKNIPTWVKGLASLAIISTMLVYLFKKH